jgi:hypothetical protein
MPVIYGRNTCFQGPYCFFAAQTHLVRRHRAQCRLDQAAPDWPPACSVLAFAPLKAR